MTTDQFAYWLQGYFEISGSSSLSDTQVQIIKDHLDLVFKKVTPNRLQEIMDISKNYPLSNQTMMSYTDNYPLAETIVAHSC